MRKTIGRAGDCGHCGRANVVLRPRGLCHTCYSNPAVAKLHKPKSANSNTVLRVPANPTRARPGSIEKIIVMAERVARGEAPTHPDDFDLRTDWGFQ